MLRLSKNSYVDDSAHELLMIPHTNLEIFDSAHKFWRMIVQIQHSISLRFYRSEANDIDISLVEMMTTLASGL